MFGPRRSGYQQLQNNNDGGPAPTPAPTPAPARLAAPASRRPLSAPAPGEVTPTGSQGFVNAASLKRPGSIWFPRGRTQFNRNQPATRAPVPKRSASAVPTARVAAAAPQAAPRGRPVTPPPQSQPQQPAVAPALKEAIAVARGRRKARAAARTHLAYKVPQEITIFGERVRMFEDETTEPTRNIVAFREEYFPTSDEETLKYARVVFAKIFGAGSKFMLDYPTYPCVEADRQVLRLGLTNRWTRLRTEITEARAGAMDIGEAVLNERIERFSRLTNLINTMEEIYANTGGSNCYTHAEPGEPAATTLGKMDDRRIQDLLRKFTYLVLQAQNPLDEYEDRETFDVVDLVHKVEQVQMPPDEMDAYIEIYQGRYAVPPLLMRLATGLESNELLADMVGNSAEMGALLTQIVDWVQKFLKGDGGGIIALGMGDYIGKFQEIFSSSEEPPVKILRIVKLLVEMTRDLLDKLDECRKRRDDAEKKERACGEALEAATGKKNALETAVQAAERRAAALAAAQEAALKSASSHAADKDALQRQLGVAGEGAAKQLQDVQAEAAAAKAAAEGHEAALGLAKTEAEAAREKHAAATATLEGLQAANKRLSDELGAKNTEVTQLKAELKGIRNEKDALAAMIQKQTEALGAGSETLKEAGMAHAGQIGELQRQHEAAIAQLQGEQGEAVRAAAERARVAQAGKEAAERTGTAAQAALQKARAEIASSSTKLEQNDAKLRGLADQARQAQQDLASQRDALARSQAEAAGAQQQAERAAAAQAALKQQLATATATGSAAAAAIQRKLVAVTAAGAAAAAAKERADKDLQDKAAALNRATADLKAATDEAAATKAANEKLKVATAAAVADAATASKKLEEVAAEKAALAADLSAAQAAAKKAADEAAAAAASHGQELEATKAAHAADLAGKIAAEENKYKEIYAAQEKEYATKSGQQAATIKGLLEKVDELVAKEEAVTAQLKAAQDAHAKKLADMEAAHANAIRNLKSQMQELTTQNGALRDEMARKQRDVEENQRKLVAAQAAAGAARATADKLQAQLETATKDSDALKAAVAAAQTKAADAERNVAAVKQQLSDANDSLTKAQADLRASAEARSKLETDLKKLQGSYDATTAAAAADRTKYEGSLGKLESQLAANKNELDQIRGTSADAVAARDQLTTEAAELKKQIDSLKLAKDTAEGQAAAAATAQATAEAALRDGDAAFKKQLQTELTRHKDEMDGIFTKILELANLVEKDQMPIKKQSPNFTQIYDRMKALKNSSVADAQTKEQRALCYLNYFVSYFLSQFFFLGADAEKDRIYRALDSAAGGLRGPVRKAVLQNLFEGLSGAETGSAPIAEAATQRILRTAANDADAIKGFFLTGFPSYRGLADKSVFSTTYPVAMAAFVVVARKYLLDIAGELADAQCAVSSFMRTPTAIDVGVEPAGPTTGIIESVNQVVAAPRRPRRTAKARRAALRRQGEAAAKVATELGKGVDSGDGPEDPQQPPPDKVRVEIPTLPPTPASVPVPVPFPTPVKKIPKHRKFMINAALKVAKERRNAGNIEGAEAQEKNAQRMAALG